LVPAGLSNFGLGRKREERPADVGQQEIMMQQMMRRLFMRLA